MLEKINEETKMAAETFDTGKLAELVRLAIGGRSLSSFAEEAGVSKSYVSKIRTVLRHERCLVSWLTLTKRHRRMVLLWLTCSQAVDIAQLNWKIKKIVLRCRLCVAQSRNIITMPCLWQQSVF